MERTFDTIAVVGVGLLGGSLGAALKQRGLAKRIHGLGRRQSSLDAAQERGLIDAGFLEIEPALERAEGVVICTPAADVCSYLDRVRPYTAKALFVTDVASTKAAICRHAATTWPAPRHFVGSHPMAGSEKFGPEHADPELYQGAYCIVEATDSVDKDARAAVRDLWAGVGCRVVEVDPEEHDRLVARTSHVPHIVAAALAKACAAHPADLAAFVGNGFRDTTRVAEGRPEVWRDICATNRHAIAGGLDDIIADLDTVRELIRNGDDAALEAFFSEGRASRLRIVGE